MNKSRNEEIRDCAASLILEYGRSVANRDISEIAELVHEHCRLRLDEAKTNYVAELIEAASITVDLDADLDPPPRTTPPRAPRFARRWPAAGSTSRRAVPCVELPPSRTEIVHLPGDDDAEHP